MNQTEEEGPFMARKEDSPEIDRPKLKKDPEAFRQKLEVPYEELRGETDDSHNRDGSRQETKDPKEPAEHRQWKLVEPEQRAHKRAKQAKRSPQHFDHSQKQNPSSVKETMKRIKWQYLLIPLTLALLTTGYSAFRLTGNHEIIGNYDISQYDHILSETEKQEWLTKEAKPREVFIQLNTKITVTEDNKANLRLINPGYSRYRYQVKLTLAGHNDALYQTHLDPGTVIEYADLNASPASGEHHAVMLYTFLDGNGKTVGTTQKEVTLSVP